MKFLLLQNRSYLQPAASKNLGNVSNMVAECVDMGGTFPKFIEAVKKD